ncbi:hypothetical protein BDB00DRAFT_122409 [Zychaea mexicana]|uniref:uncharacterized protein n=1 Tax=Zychaea mexicana TaxID=64656 RepID=UPI0022FEAC17|nr:uncharacterized protein BDB00DRAFT_122409 [Zychaea mexicana]KAI9496515.1 hypothetical protein BDB00DRAFT_122409 [Zychaea mexicana]
MSNDGNDSKTYQSRMSFAERSGNSSNNNSSSSNRRDTAREFRPSARDGGFATNNDGWNSTRRSNYNDFDQQQQQPPYRPRWKEHGSSDFGGSGRSNSYFRSASPFDDRGSYVSGWRESYSACQMIWTKHTQASISTNMIIFLSKRPVTTCLTLLKSLLVRHLTAIS